MQRFEYHNAPKGDAFLENGWSTLGDISRLDEDDFST